MDKLLSKIQAGELDWDATWEVDSPSTALARARVVGLVANDADTGLASRPDVTDHDLKRGLAYAVGGRQVAAVLVLAHNCGERLEEPGRPTSTPSADELFVMAGRNEWASVAYHLACCATSKPLLAERLRATDSPARTRLKKIAGGVRVHIPRDLRGKIDTDVHVEQPRWLLPRPRKDECFMTVEGRKLEEGWYSVVQYPVSDDLKEAVLRSKFWSFKQCEDASTLLQQVGETLLCKAVKSEQWVLVEWILDREGALQMAQQVDAEFAYLWDNIERRASLQSRRDLEQLYRCLIHSGADKGTLKHQWRSGPSKVPVGAALVWPRLEILQEAMALESLSLEALRQIGGAVVTFRLPLSSGARKRWLGDLHAATRDCVSTPPLLHRAVALERRDLQKQLLTATVDVDVADSRGLTALAVAAAAGKWDAVEDLLIAGCRADGRSAAVAIAEVQRLGRSGAEDCGRAEGLLEKIKERKERAPCKSLSDYFRLAACDKVMHGIEPRSFELNGGQLCRRDRKLSVWTYALKLLDSPGVEEEDIDIVFAALSSEEFLTVAETRVLDLLGRRLLTEDLLLAEDLPLAVPAALPRRRLGASDRAGECVMLSDGGGRLANLMPVLARAPAQGGLLVESVTACCREVIERVDVIVDGVRVGETPQPAGGFLVPARLLPVGARMSGRPVKQEEPVQGGPDALFEVEVPVGIFVYVQLVDEETQLEFVYVAGHHRDIPPEARPFCGTATWDNGNTKLTVAQEAVEMGPSGCLARLQSLELVPDLAPGRSWERDEWIDTGTPECPACQFQRLLRVPVKVGKIFPTPTAEHGD